MPIHVWSSWKSNCVEVETPSGRRRINPDSGYSDNGVDVEVRKYLPEIGYACDVGANDGKSRSNSLLFEEMGWTVLCVEPNPIYEKQGRELRKLWRSVAAGAEDREATFWDVAGPSWSTIDHGSGTPHQVQMYRLDRLLEEANFPRLDYLTVDVEGYEPHVFAGFTLSRWNPLGVVYEAWSEEAAQKINLPGYRFVNTLGFDRIYVRESGG